MSLRPIHDKVLVRLAPPKEKTDGGIIIPTSANQRDQAVEGVVVATGPGLLLENGKRLAPSVSEGDRVLVPRHAGTAIKKDGASHLVLLDEEILAVLED